MDKINFQKPEFFSAFGIYPSITPLTWYLFFACHDTALFADFTSNEIN